MSESGKAHKHHQDKAPFPLMTTAVVMGVLLILVFIEIWYWLYVTETYNKGELAMEGVGQFGDAFGALNPLFSTFTLIGVAFAIVYQKWELDETRRANSENIRLLREEQAERLHSKQRAGTLTAENTITAIVTKEDKINYAFTMKNTGERVFNVSPYISEEKQQLGYSACARSHSPFIDTEEEFLIEITGPVDIDPMLRLALFELNYHDSTGSSRKQTYMIQTRKDECYVVCVKYGFPNNEPPV